MTATGTRAPGVEDVQASATQGLRAALMMLDGVIQLRREERQGGIHHRPLSIDGVDEGIPALSRYATTGPLAEVIATARLSDAEALALVAAVAPEIDERFAVAFGELTDRPGVLGLTGEVARTLVARSFDGRMAAHAMLSPHATLRASGLVALVPADDMAGALRPEPGLVAWLLGLPAPTEHATAEFPARPLTTVHSLADVVLPPRTRARIGDLAARLAHRDRVLRDWGMAAHHDNAAGLVALFHGPSGTGKTMTAAAIAASIGLPAYVVDLSALVSKYIGETEKALAAVFERAERERLMLVFDEADAVFGSRTEVSDSHDRYANQEVSYLLSRIESHPGVVVLTSNLLGNIDSAFRRRIHLMIEFPAPGQTERIELWRRALPPSLPIAADVDLDTLAVRFPLTGAQIRDAVMDAAYLAADGPGMVEAAVLDRAIRHQFVKAGKTVPS